MSVYINRWIVHMRSSLEHNFAGFVILDINLAYVYKIKIFLAGIFYNSSSPCYRLGWEQGTTKLLFQCEQLYSSEGIHISPFSPGLTHLSD